MSTAKSQNKSRKSENIRAKSIIVGDPLSDEEVIVAPTSKQIAEPAVDFDDTRQSFLDPPWYKRHLVDWNLLNQDEVACQEARMEMRQLYGESDLMALAEIKMDNDNEV